MPSPTILIVEDNDEVRELLKVILCGRGFEVEDTAHGQEAIDICEDRTPDLVVLDLTLPDIDGLEVCRRIKSFSRMESVPILICSARAHVSERVKGLEAGADDYLTKPFDPAELVARVKVLLKRTGLHSIPETRKPIQSGDLRLDPNGYQTFLNGKKIAAVTQREFDILYLLVERSSEIVSRSEISKSILGKEHDEESRVIDMHIAQIRKKVPQLADKIVTIPGKGYQWFK